MTFQPPPPPPPPGGSVPPPPPPPPGGNDPYGADPYGAAVPPPPPPPPAPGAMGPAGMPGTAPQWGMPATPPAGFNARVVNPYDWTLLVIGFLTFIFSFVSYYHYSAKFSELGVSGTVTKDWNAWHGFFGWFGMLCALVGSGLVALVLFAPQVKLPFAARLGALFAYALATLCLILAIFVIPGNTSGASAVGVHIDKGHAWGFWLSLVLVIAGLVISLMRAQQTNTVMPGALNKMPKIGGNAA